MSSWLVTGGTGSFGHAFVESLLREGVDRIVVFSRDELKQAQMAQKFSDERLRFMIGNVVDRTRLDQALRGVDYVVHAAAMKRIDTCEDHPAEAVDTNILGTLAVAHGCIAAGVQKAVFLSTDKAAAPNTHYGATKLAAERLWIGSNVYAAGTPTRLAATRYGNVLGSRGSVVPLFRKQAETGTLTLTDPQMTRFWMPLDEAVALVRLAFSEMRGGEVFVPCIPACSIATLAKAVAPDARHEVIGIRPGEKMHEMLISEDEARTTRDHGTHYCIEPVSRSWEDEQPPVTGKAVPDGFSYRSDTNPWQLDEVSAHALVNVTEGKHGSY